MPKRLSSRVWSIFIYYVFRNRRIAWSKANNSHLFVCFCSPKNTKHPLLLSEVHSFDDETLGGGSRCGHQRNPIMSAFCEKSLICQEGKSMTPCRGSHFSRPFLPATPLSPSRTLEGLFELTWHPTCLVLSQE